MDSSIKPDHSRCNSLLHWRKAGHFYCQGRKNVWRWGQERENRENEREASARTKRHLRECWKEGEEDSSQWNCETIRYRFCHGGMTLTASCTPCLSHVGWLLMEPSYPGWTSVMKVYSSYWIWRWDLCLSHSCSPAFILQPQPPCGGHIYTHKIHSAVWSPVQRVYIAAHHCKYCLPLWIGLSTVHFCCILILFLSFSRECWELNRELIFVNLAKGEGRMQT